MSKIRSSNANFSIGGTAVETYIRNLTQNIDQGDIDVTTIGDSGPRSLIDNYTHNYDLDGPNDYASGAIDAVLFGLVGDENGAATVFQPTGNSAGSSDPNYTSEAVLRNYQISVGVGGAQSYRASLKGSIALTRDVTP